MKINGCYIIRLVGVQTDNYITKSINMIFSFRLYMTKAVFSIMEGMKCNMCNNLICICVFAHGCDREKLSLKIHIEDVMCILI